VVSDGQCDDIAQTTRPETGSIPSPPRAEKCSLRCAKRFGASHRPDEEFPDDVPVGAPMASFRER
jgi:hypothetical protein